MATSAALAKLNSKALTKAVSQSEGLNKPLKGTGQFKEMLGNMQSATDFADKLGMTSNQIDPAGNMKSLPGSEVNFTPTQEVAKADGPDVSKKVINMLSEVNKGQMQMDSMVNQILHGGQKFNNQELMAIQAHVYHYAQMAELTVKVAEHGTSSFQKIWGTNIG